MNDNLLTEINIIDFKCFKNFKVDGFKRVNLISGKNNIGKTAFMEACYINVYSQDNLSMATAIFDIKVMRENINLLSKYVKGVEINSLDFLEYIKKCSIESNIIKTCKFEIVNSDGNKEYIFNDNRINAKYFSFDFKQIDNIEYIDNFGFTDAQLIEVYETIQKEDKEAELNGLINQFDNSIDSFKVIGETPQCKIDGEYRELVEFGDGLKHYISIICAMYACKNGQLFIDEIDNGIHYTQLKSMWKLIFEISQKTNCQVFATTHSKECIEAFNELNASDDGAYFELFKNQKTGSISFAKRDHEQLSYALLNDGKIRGE